MAESPSSSSSSSAMSSCVRGVVGTENGEDIAKAKNRKSNREEDDKRRSEGLPVDIAEEKLPGKADLLEVIPLMQVGVT